MSMPVAKTFELKSFQFTDTCFLLYENVGLVSEQRPTAGQESLGLPRWATSILTREKAHPALLISVDDEFTLSNAVDRAASITLECPFH